MAIAQAVGSAARAHRLSGITRSREAMPTTAKAKPAMSESTMELRLRAMMMPMPMMERRRSHPTQVATAGAEPGSAESESITRPATTKARAMISRRLRRCPSTMTARIAVTATDEATADSTRKRGSSRSAVNDAAYPSPSRRSPKAKSHPAARRVRSGPVAELKRCTPSA